MHQNCILVDEENWECAKLNIGQRLVWSLDFDSGIYILKSNIFVIFKYFQTLSGSNEIPNFIDNMLYKLH